MNIYRQDALLRNTTSLRVKKYPTEFNLFTIAVSESE